MKKNTRTTKELDKKEELQKANAKDIFKDLTWPCHICDRERPDKRISVATGNLKNFEHCQINIRYCNDNPVCEAKAVHHAEIGVFPERIVRRPTRVFMNNNELFRFRVCIVISLFFMLMVIALIGKNL